MAQNTDLIKEKLTVADVVRQYVALTPAGKYFKGLCPFHKEKSPSFVVSPDRGIWHCFGCGVGGDIFSFVMKFENVEFVEALKILADKAGVSLQRIGTSDQKKYDVLYEINRVAKDFFKSTLHDLAGKSALKYLTERGLKPQTIDEFEVGLALPNQDALMRHLAKLGYSLPDIERAGLIFKTDRGTYWDRFRNRIMFPIHNHFGKVVGFTGRVMPGNESADVGKYVNSPETPIFNKSKLLFGFWKTKGAIRDANAAVLVEGQMDFLMAHQDGVSNIAASSGTALTADHLTVLRRLTDSLILSFDNDSAGKIAAERTIDAAGQLDFMVKILMPDDPALKDPADIARAKPGHLKTLISRAVSAMEYYFSYYNVGMTNDIAAKKKAVRQALTKIKALASPLEQAHWTEQLAMRSGVSPEVLRQEMATLKSGLTTIEKPQEQTQAELPKSKFDIICRQLLALAVSDKEAHTLVAAHQSLLPPLYAKAFEYLEPDKIATASADVGPLVNLIHLQSSMLPTELLGDTKKIVREAQLLIDRLGQEDKGGRKKALQLQIAEAERQGESAKLNQLLEEYRKLTNI